MGRASERPLRIGLNLLYLVRRAGGAGTYARQLIPRLLEAEPGTRLTLFVSRELADEDRAAPWAGEVEWVVLPVNFTHGPPWNLALTAAAQWVAEPVLAARRRLDVIHGLANMTPLVAPRAATVVTLLDLIWLRFPDTMTARETLGTKLSAIPSARAADRVIAISRAARDEMVARIGLDPDRIDVVPLAAADAGRAEGAPEAELRRELGLGERPVVLCVSQKRTHKNLAALVRAMPALADLDAVLVLPGSPTPHEAELRELARQLGAERRVIFPEWLTDAQLEGLYGLAACFVLPSFEEGFGLPILDAMRRGVPVACSNVSALPEVAGDAALLFDPGSADEIVRALRRVVADGAFRAELVERGDRRWREFSWRATAEATLVSYRRAIERRRLLSWDRR